MDAAVPVIREIKSTKPLCTSHPRILKLHPPHLCSQGLRFAIGPLPPFRPPRPYSKTGALREKGTGEGGLVRPTGAPTPTNQPGGVHPLQGSGPRSRPSNLTLTQLPGSRIRGSSPPASTWVSHLHRDVDRDEYVGRGARIVSNVCTLH